MTRIYNFSAGPATLPEAVLKEAALGLVDYQGSGMGLPEMSHRSKPFIAVMADAVAGTKRLLNIPENYEVLFLQGGATLQFSMLAMNFLVKKGAYISTGTWSEKAVKEASAIGATEVIASSKADKFSFIPKNIPVTLDADYLHITSNNTIYGTQYKTWPKTNVPLIVDASSDILSRPIDFEGVGMVYAGAQKNIGPSGVVMVIIRKDLLAKEPPRILPSFFKYSVHAEAESMSNTPPTFAVYMVKLALDHLEKNGGVAAMEKINIQKAKLVYDVIDASDFYTGLAKSEDRSLMNVVFTLPSEELTEEFLSGAKKLKMDGLKGYRSLGGIRASIYNAMPMEGAKTLADFMTDFAAKKG